MGRNRGGYTIIEVMVVIAITAALFLSALALINGQQGDTRFTQVMQDLSSKMQNYVSQIKAGSYPGMENYVCNTSSNRPVLATTGTSDSSCIVLGRAFEVQPGAANKAVIHSYIVLGTRTYTSGGVSQTATTIDQANPEPAGTINSGIFSYVLVDDYTVGGGAYVVSSKSANINYNLVGLYNQLEGNIDSSGSNPVLSMRGYVFSGYPDQTVQLRSCLEGQSTTPPCAYTGGSANIPTLNQWKLCIDSGSGTTAELEVDSSAAGVTTKYNLKACS